MSRAAELRKDGSTASEAAGQAVDERLAEVRTLIASAQSATSATGNNGAFDPASADIRYSDDGPSGPAITEPQARAAVAATFGDKTARVLLDAGLIEFVTGRDFNGATYSDGRIQINLDAVTQDSIGGVLKHEAFHAAVKDWLGAGPYAALMNRMATLGKMAASSGPLKTWFDKANAAVPTGTRPEHLNEELAAYAIQQSADAKQPGMIAKWAQDFMSALRTAIIRLMPDGKLKAWALLNIQPQDLARMAVQAMQARGAAVRSEAQGELAYSKSEQIDTPAFDAQSSFERHGGKGDVDESTDITAKSNAFADMAEADGWSVAGRGDKYATLTKVFGKDSEGYERKAVVKVRISDHSNINRSAHFGETDINIAPDDGHPRETFAKALEKLRSARLTEDLTTVFDGLTGQFDPTNPDIRYSRTTDILSSVRNAGGGPKIVGGTGRYTPEQLAAMSHVGFQVEAPTLDQRVKALWQNAGQKLAQGLVDQFAPVKSLDGEAYGLLRLAKGASGAFETLLQGGKLKLNGGVYDFDDQAKGGVIETLLKPLGGEHHDFFRWIAANRAERLLTEKWAAVYASGARRYFTTEQEAQAAAANNPGSIVEPAGRENLFTETDIAALKTLADGRADFDYTIQNGARAGQTTRDRSLIYADALKTFNGFNKNVLDMAEQSGLIDGESRAIWEHDFYVPFYRVADSADGGLRGVNIKGGAVRQQAFKTLKGGAQALNADLLDNTLMNWAHLIDASAKNRAAKATLEAAERMGVAVSSTEEATRQMAKSMGKADSVVWFMDEGVKHFYVVEDPMLLTAIGSLEYAGMRSPIMTALGSFKHALTIGVTASPFFKVRNLIRDSVQAIGTAPIGYNPASNVAQGWALTDPKSDAYFRLLAGGGTIHFGTMMEGNEAKRVQALVESGVDKATILNSDQKVKAFYRAFIEPSITAYNELGNRGEAITRAALYAQLTAQGVSHAQASLQARDLMDFSMQGSFTSVRFLAQVVPFFNARLQGLYKLGRAAKEDPARFSAVIGAATLAGLSLMLAFSDDDDWKKREDWDRNGFWWFKFGGTAFRIPKPFEIGAIASLAERGFEYAFDKEMTGKRFRSNVLSLLGDNLSMNPIPQMAKPLLDVYANKDSFTGRPIESLGMQRLKAEYRFNSSTSMLARGASTAMNSAAGLVGADAFSPVQVDHMLRGYFGWLGTFVVGAGDILARPLTGQPEKPDSDILKAATGGMLSDLRDAPSRYVSQMYVQAKAIEQDYATWRELLKEGKVGEAQEFYAEHREDIGRHKVLERTKASEAKVSQQIKRIEEGDMSGAEKRERIRELLARKDQIARPVMAVN